MTAIKKEVVIGECRLILGDSLEVMKELEPVDCVISDPPYGIGYSHGKGGGKLAASTVFDNHPIIGDEKPFDPSHLLKYDTVLLFGANHFADKLPPSPNWLIWDKRDGVCTNDQADCELAWTNKKGPARLIRHLWNGMLKASEKGVRRVHPTQKPIAVMEWAINQVWSKGTILDPYMGSGTTLVACAKLGRKGIGIELDEDYFNIAVERVRAAYDQPDLFLNTPKKAEQINMDLDS